MSWLDITLMCLAGIGFVKGLFDGIVKQAISLIALVLGIIFCSKGAKWLYQYLSTFDYFSENITMLICYIAAFLLIAGIVLLAGEITSKIIGATPLSIINHLTGGFFGLSVMVIFLSLVLNIADAIDKESLLLTKSVKEESRFFYPVKGLLPAIFPSEWFSLRTFNSHTPDIV